jgi:hypothetical protein
MCILHTYWMEQVRVLHHPTDHDLPHPLPTAGAARMARRMLRRHAREAGGGSRHGTLPDTATVSGISACRAALGSSASSAGRTVALAGLHRSGLVAGTRVAYVHGPDPGMVCAHYGDPVALRCAIHTLVASPVTYPHKPNQSLYDSGGSTLWRDADLLVPVSTPPNRPIFRAAQLTTIG